MMVVMSQTLTASFPCVGSAAKRVDFRVLSRLHQKSAAFDQHAWQHHPLREPRGRVQMRVAEARFHFGGSNSRFSTTRTRCLSWRAEDQTNYAKRLVTA